MHRRRLALVAGIVVAIGGLSAAGWGLFAYNAVTQIDRSEPEVVADEFLRAVLVRKDSVGADLYACSNQHELVPIMDFRRELDNREREFGVTIIVSWGVYQRSGSELKTDLTITAFKNNAVESRNDETWRFTLVEEDGWRVCGSERIEDSPT